MADRLANQPGCNTCGCDDCPAITSCFALIVCASYVPDEAMTITGTDLAKVPTGESASGATGGAGEAFCHTWASRPAWSLVEFTWKSCHLAAYLPTNPCTFSFDFDVCIARGVLFEAYDILDAASVPGVLVCVNGRRVTYIPWTDHDSFPCVPSGTVREVYWWNVHPAYAAPGMDCPMTAANGIPPSTMAGVVIRTFGIIDGTTPQEYAPYIWECDRVDPWCCEDDAELRVGGLPVDDPDGLWSFYPCHSGPWVGSGPSQFGVSWGCVHCRAAADMTYANMGAWAKNVHYEINCTYYYPSGFLLPPASQSVTLSGTLPFDCPPYALDDGSPVWDSGSITVSWPAGYYYFSYETPGIDPPHPYNVTSIRILFGPYKTPGSFGIGWFIIQALANDIPPGGFSFDGCDRAPRTPRGWAFEPDTPESIFVQQNEGSPYGQCDHHIDWTGTATEPYSPVTCRLYGTVSVTGPVAP